MTEASATPAARPATPARRAPGAGPAKVRLDRALLAMVRGWVQGMDAREVARHHLNLDPEAAADLRVAKSRLQYALDELAAAARREGRALDAALLKRQAARIRPRAPSAAPPTLEAFAERFPPDFYREEELVELYAAEFGAGDGNAQAPGASRRPRAGGSGEARRARLIDRQLALIAFLEERLGAAMTPRSALSDWLEPTLAARLEAAGLRTVLDLVQRIEGSRVRWWAGIAGVGETKARRIEQLLEASLGPLRHRAAAPGGGSTAGSDAAALTAPAYDQVDAYGIAPLERLRVPARLDGSAGTLRIHDGAALIEACNDHEAIVAFLATHSSDHTRRAYRKELERFLLWAVVVRGKPLSSMTVDDCVAYRAFLADPQPRTIWCGVRSRQRFGPLWRPFEGPLSARSQVHAVQCLHTFYRWAGEVRYLAGNPWAHVKVAGSALPTESGRSASAGTVESHDAALRAQFRPRERALSVEQWRFVCEQLATLHECGRTRRLRFVLAFAYSTGLRLSELVRARRAHLAFEAPEADDPGGWVLAVLGKGDRLREVTLLDEVVVALKRYLAERGLPGDLAAVDPSVYLIGRVDDLRERLPAADALHGGAPLAAGDGVKGTTLYREVKGFFAHCAAALEARDAKGAARLRAASTHWLRHSHATHALAKGVPLQIVREVLGHASLSTTSRYVKPERGDQRRALRKIAGLTPAD